MKCKKCGRINLNISTRCTKCGADLTKPKTYTISANEKQIKQVHTAISSILESHNIEYKNKEILKKVLTELKKYFIK